MNVYQILKKKFNIKLKHHNTRGAYKNFMLPRAKGWFYYHELAHLLQLKNYEQHKKQTGKLNFTGRSTFPNSNITRLSKKDYKITQREIETYMFQYKLAKYSGLLKTEVVGLDSMIFHRIFTDAKGSLIYKLRVKFDKRINKRLIKKRVKRENLFQKLHLSQKGFE